MGMCKSAYAHTVQNKISFSTREIIVQNRVSKGTLDGLWVIFCVRYSVYSPLFPPADAPLVSNTKYIASIRRTPLLGRRAPLGYAFTLKDFL